MIGSRQADAGRAVSWCREVAPKLEYMMDYGMPQWLAKVDSVMRFTRWEQLFLGRQKFYHFRVWYRNQLADHVRQVLLDQRTLGRPYLNGGHVEHIVKEHVNGRGNYTLEIHKLLTSELIARHLIEQN